jgi:3-oxoacyl-[acyl-carrier protein] reductase
MRADAKTSPKTPPCNRELTAANKQAVVTGSTRGIGLAIASRLARDGFTLVLNYAHDDQQAKEAFSVIQSLAPHSILVKADMTQESEVKTLLQQATQRGPIDVWINNVGDFLFKPFLTIRLEEWKRVLDSNLTSVFLCCQAVIPHMRAHGGGQIINIGFMHGEVLRAVPNIIPYTIAKTGLLILTKSLAKTEGRHGIRVNAINPGFIETGPPISEQKRQHIALQRMGDPEEIAAAVAFLVSEEARYITGAILDIHGGAYL